MAQSSKPKRPIHIQFQSINVVQVWAEPIEGDDEYGVFMRSDLPGTTPSVVATAQNLPAARAIIDSITATYRLNMVEGSMVDVASLKPGGNR